MLEISKVQFVEKADEYPTVIDLVPDFFVANCESLMPHQGETPAHAAALTAVKSDVARRDPFNGHVNPSSVASRAKAHHEDGECWELLGAETVGAGITTPDQRPGVNT